MKPRKTKEEEKRIDSLVNEAFSKNSDGIQVDVFDISKVLDAGRSAAAIGGDGAIEPAIQEAFLRYGQNGQK